jgi:hypothetical protein
MKYIPTILFVLSAFCNLKSQTSDYYNRMNNVFGAIDPAKVTTGFLKEFGIRYNEVEVYNGIIRTSNYVDITQWQSLYSSLYSMRVGSAASSMSDPGLVFSYLSNQQSANPTHVLLAAQYYTYQQYKTNAYTNGDVRVSNDSIFDVPGRNPYETKSVFAVTALKSELSGQIISFKLPSNLIYTNSTLTLSSVQVDFGNGQGYQNLVLNMVKNVS